MVEESSPLLPNVEESIEAETEPALEPGPESGERTPEPASEPGFVCECQEWMRSACTGLPFYREHQNRSYCVLHYPGRDKGIDFQAALDNKLNKKDFDFRGVWFPDKVDFSGFEFVADADFNHATFSADADFSYARFSTDADFRYAKFSTDADFAFATFSAVAFFISARFSAAAYFTKTTFSAIAFFRSATFSADADFISATFSAAADFISATFSADAYFSYARLSADADFSSATFSAGADFTKTTFSTDATFTKTTFSAVAAFSSATFGADAYFRDATFSADAYFSSATFSADAYFSSATFGTAADFDRSLFHAHASFSGASFDDSVRFFGRARKRELKNGASLGAMALGNNPALDFQHVRVEHPDRIAFHTLNLRPHWFVNIDSRQFVFTDVGWEWERFSIKQEIAALERNKVSSPYPLLAIACRQLAENAEANNRYEEASRFRYYAMDLARLTKWKGASFWKTDWLHLLYWAVSGYGERILRALGVLATVWIVFVMLYTRVGFVQQLSSNQSASSAMAASMTVEDRIGQPLEFSRALTYSFAVMSLQKPEPKPLTGTAQTLVLLETILGPVQAALLALAIRRKFMR